MNRYIDADLLKQSIPDTKMDEFENCRYCRLLDEEQVKDLIDQQPTADVRENVRGEWINAGGDDWRCSICGNVIHTEGSFEKPLDVGNYYCLNCGADMRGEA